MGESILMFLPFVIFLLNNLCLSKVIVWLHSMHTGVICFQMVSECASVPCEMAGPATVQFSAQHVSQKNHRAMADAYQVFVPFTHHCKVILLHLPPLITQQLWEKKVSEPSKH